MISGITTPQASVTNKTYGFDNNYNITAITDPVTPGNSATVTYDLNNRISTYNYATNTHSYNFNTSYDLTSKTDNTATTSFNYSSTSHQLNSLSGAQTDTISTDLNGNVTGFNGLNLSYDPKNRLSSLTDSNSLTTTYSVNYAGQRTEKTNTNNTSYFVYDAAGALIGDYDSSGNVQNEYIYLNGNPVALMQNNNLYYVYDDHLGTPRTITDTANNVQWTWENSEAFGNNQPVSVVSGFTFNLRFPGQYFDNESNLSYNTHRDYNPNWGRYVESDPIGLAGGLNTYGYVEGNSLSNFDYLGLNPFTDFNNFVTDPKTVDFVGAVGDQLYSAATFSLGNGATLRDYLNISPLNITSSNYALGDGIGFAIGMIAPVPGKKVEVAYSVYYEMRLAPQFWKASRPVHFREANRALLNDMANDCELKNMLEGKGIKIPVNKNGTPQSISPQNFTWHHEIDNGIMRLVPRAEHESGSSFSSIYHPNNKGGYSKWGK